MNIDAQKVLLGLLGERIVAHFLRASGHTVVEPLNVFDEEKDMMVDGNNVEVKTQVPLVVEDSFAISPKQKMKVMGCHRVYFVSVPLIKDADELAGYVFEMDPADPKLKAHRWHANDGRKMVCFPRRQSALKIIGVVKDQMLLEQMRKLSTSYL